MDTKFFVLIFLIYLLGSIPFALILTKIFGYGDIRKIGSGNIGTTNVLRTGNKFLTILVLLFDSFKGFFPIFYLINFSSIMTNYYEFNIYILGSAAILGHIFPIFLKFKGGKGVATYLGFLFGVNYILGLFFIFIWISVVLLKQISSLASIIALLLIPFLMIFLSFNPSILSLFSIISLIMIYKHLPNIKRLINNKEPKIKL